MAQVDANTRATILVVKEDGGYGGNEGNDGGDDDSGNKLGGNPRTSQYTIRWGGSLMALVPCGMKNL